MTITSPSGTIVTLTTDNGGSNDNVFAGTLWDDSADPLGAALPISASGLVTDHTYANLVPVPSLTPEEPLGALRGENPNGVWTLTIVDDSTSDGGSLDGWGLSITTLPAAPTRLVTTTASSEVDFTLPGPVIGNDVLTPFTLAVEDVTDRIVDVNIHTAITHPFGADLDVTITSPWGTIVTLTTDNAAGNDNIFASTLWDDDADPAGALPQGLDSQLVTDHTFTNLVVATPLTPEEPLSAFNGEDPAGVWTLTFNDDLAGDVGNVRGWGIDLVLGSCVEVPGAPQKVVGKERNRSLVVSWTPPTDDGGGLIEGYKVVTLPGGKSCSSLATKCTVKNLRNGVAYGVVVTAKNLAGRGPGSAATAPLVPRTSPSAPRKVTAVAGNGSARVSWLEPSSDGGARITKYVVTSKPGKKQCTTKGKLTCTVKSLRSGTSYAFTVKAKNEAGTGPASSKSNAVQAL